MRVSERESVCVCPCMCVRERMSVCVIVYNIRENEKSSE